MVDKSRREGSKVEWYKGELFFNDDLQRNPLHIFVYIRLFRRKKLASIINIS